MRITILLLLLASSAHAWDSEELEIFDLVEDISENFYAFMAVQPDCTLAELKRAFRTLTLQLHPDKNDGIDEDNRFRKLVSIYEVLKDTSKRGKYDLVLKNGLPNWKSAAFYYRRVHRMGLAEMAAIVFVIVSVGQYLCAWAAYAEKRYTAEELIGSKLRRRKAAASSSAGGASGMDAATEAWLDEIKRPSVLNTLPFQLPLALWHTPSAILGVIRAYRQHQLDLAADAAAAAAEEAAQLQREEDYLREKEARKAGLKKRKEKFAAQEKSDADLEGFARLQHIKKLESIQAARSRAEAVAASASTGATGAFGGGFWSDDDLIELIRLVKKHPGGTPARWEVIAEQMSRSVPEITFMAAKMKEKGYRLPGQTTATMASSSVAETIVAETAQKLQQQCAPTIAIPELQASNWSQEQQRQLEAAMIKYPKAVPGDRWQLIAGVVEGKTRLECFERFKHLVQMLKAQKETVTVPKVMEAGDAPPQPPASKSKLKSSSESTATGGKKRNKRKERKKNMDFSSDDDDEEEEE